VSEALSDGTIDASEITVQVQNGEVTLSGSVTDRRMKFYAESCAERVMGVTDVNNQLKIARTPSSTSSDGGRAGTTGSSSLRDNNNDDAQSPTQRSTARSTTTSAR